MRTNADGPAVWHTGLSSQACGVGPRQARRYRAGRDRGVPNRASLGIAQGALDHALGYVEERDQFGRPIGEFQGLQFMLADMGMQLQAARQLTYAAAARADRGDADLTYFGAAAKCFASHTAMKVTTDAVQLLGDSGYTHDYPVERMMRDAKLTQIYEGPNPIQRIVFSRAQRSMSA